MEVGRGDRSSCLAEGLGSVAAGGGVGLGFFFRIERVKMSIKVRYEKGIRQQRLGLCCLIPHLLHW